MLVGTDALGDIKTTGGRHMDFGLMDEIKINIEHLLIFILKSM